MLGYREGVRFLLLASDTGASSLDQVDSRSGNKFFDLSSCISSRDPFGRKDGCYCMVRKGELKQMKLHSAQCYYLGHDGRIGGTAASAVSFPLVIIII